MARQTALPDTRLFKADVIEAITETRKAAMVPTDRLFALENLLESVGEEVR